MPRYVRSTLDGQHRSLAGKKMHQALTARGEYSPYSHMKLKIISKREFLQVVLHGRNRGEASNLPFNQLQKVTFYSRHCRFV